MWIIIFSIALFRSFLWLVYFVAIKFGGWYTFFLKSLESLEFSLQDIYSPLNEKIVYWLINLLFSTILQRLWFLLKISSFKYGVLWIFVLMRRFFFLCNKFSWEQFQFTEYLSERNFLSTLLYQNSKKVVLHHRQILNWILNTI